MHLGAVIGQKVPFWDQYDEFGDTNLLLVKPEEGASLARALGQAPLVLMKGHGATVVGSNVQELVFRTIYSCRNAEYQFLAKMLGNVTTLRPGEVQKSPQIYCHADLQLPRLGILDRGVWRRPAVESAPAAAAKRQLAPAASVLASAKAKAKKTKGRKR